jgi:hypothetical protein
MPEGFEKEPVPVYRICIGRMVYQAEDGTGEDHVSFGDLLHEAPEILRKGLKSLFATVLLTARI